MHTLTTAPLPLVAGPKQPNGEHIPAATIHSDMGYVLIASVGRGVRLDCL